MDHAKHVVDGWNKDIAPTEFYDDAVQRLLDLAGDWKDPYPDPVVAVHDGIHVVRDDMLAAGTKQRGGALFMERMESDTVVYVQPRVGLAGVSILEAAKLYGKKVVLFMPASKRISLHQACTIERGAVPMFKRIAAMPVLNAAAKKWAEENGAAFVPLGLKHPLVTAAIMKAAMKIPAPDVAYVATSTGVLTRSLQLAWKKTEFVSVCVARNMKAGELGRATPITYPLEFAKPAPLSMQPPFPTVPTYDAKVWQYAVEGHHEVGGEESADVLMWNVGKEPVLQDETLPDRIDSRRNW